ncbi:porin [Variovorax sp. J22P240]|uniref:porin n=1 Tax=unclassified Variovorax TaxID=663243 RepID=UPI002577619A|nr:MULTISPECIES: porin [unclassified Variovorax]MDL9999128.1 porin [Variovorax sp. J22P240]MDM0052698.1 porin [Variovorax sp. J22R115]
MKKYVAAMMPLAALMSIGTASAQSTVTLFGIVDTGVSSYWNQAQGPFGTTITTKQTLLTNSAYNSSRLGFKGTEDLGGGLLAGFWLEAGINSDDGTGVSSNGGLQFNRRSTVSLEGGFGEIRLGRDYTPTYWNDNLFDPFGVNGVGTSLISTASGQTSPGSVRSGWTNGQYSRSSNSIGYFLPKLGGFYGQFMYAFNESTRYDPGGLTPPGVAAIVADPSLASVADDARAGRYIGGRVGYNNGPLDVALAYGESTVGSNFYLGTTSNINIWSIGGTYDFGVVKLFGEYSNNKMDTSFATNAFNPFGTTRPGFDGLLIGATIPVVGYDLIRVSYSAVRYNNVNTDFFGFNPNPEADKFAIGYVYNFSKRTAVYATFAYLSNKNGAALTVGGPAYYTAPIAGFAPVPDKSYGYDLGLRHSF